MSSIKIPKSVTSIVCFGTHDDNLVIKCYKDSYAEKYAKEHGFKYICIDQDESELKNKASQPLSVNCKNIVVNGKKLTIKTTGAKGKLTYKSLDTSVATVNTKGEVASKKRLCISLE